MSELSRNRVDQIRRLYVETERDDQFRRQMTALLTEDVGDGRLRPRRFGLTKEARGLVLTGAPGQGKTSLLMRGLRDLLGAGDGTAEKPFLAIDVPSPATLKSLGAEIVRATGFEVSTMRDPQHKFWERARHRMAC